MAHYTMPPFDPQNDLKCTSYTDHQELELESQATSADQSYKEAQCWSQLTLNIQYPCLLQPAQPPHQMLEEESYFTFLPQQQEEKVYTAEEDSSMSESSLHLMQDSRMSQCSFAPSQSFLSSCSESMEASSLTFGQQYSSSQPQASYQSSAYPHTAPNQKMQEPSEASFGSTIPIPHFYQASSFQNPLQPLPIVSSKIEQGIIKSVALDNTKFPIYTDSQIGVQQLTPLHLIASNGDEDYESDSETMERSRLLCEGDLRQVEEIIERKGADIMRQKVHNYRRYCRQ